jgi:hypothetical protein
MSRSADFFDAPEYMWRTVEPTLFKAMSTGHSPFHPLYVFFSYLIYKSGLTFGSTLTATILPSVILGSFSVVLVFLLIKNLFNSKIAWICTVLYGLLPFVFISQITALVDPTEHFFYFLSLYLLVLALEKHRQEYLLALLAGLSFGLAAFAHTQVAFWALGLISVLIIKNDDWQKANIKKIFFKIVLFCLGGSVFLFAYLQILVSASSREHLNVYNYKDALKLMLFDNTGERNPLVVTRFLRQFATVATSLVLVSSLIGFILMLKDKLYKQATALVLWFLPGAAITSTYIYENLHGRAMIIALVPVLVFVSYFILRVRLKFAAIIFALILAQILIILIPQLYLYHFVVSPNQNLSDLQRNSKPDGLFISSNVTRTLSAYNGSFVSLGDLGSGQAQKLVETTLSQNKPAYVSSDALRMPLRRFDGHFYDIRSTEINGATGHPSLLFGLLNNYDLVLDNFSNLYPQQVYRIYQSAPDTATSDALAHLDKESIVFGQILSNGKPVSSAAVNQYNPVFCKVPNEDQTRLDAAFCLSRYFTGFEEATDWTYTGKDGKFYLPVKDDNFNLVIGPSSTNTRSDDLGTQFAVQEPLSFVGQEIGVFTELSQLQDSINSLSSSYYVFAERSNEKNTYILFRVDFSLPKSGKIEARDLSGEIGEIIKDNSIGEEVRSNVKTATGGFLSSGPYVNLPKGEYQIDFSVRSKVKEGTPNLNFDVFSSDTGKTYVEKNVSVSSLKSDQYQTVSLIFSLSASTNLIEFRLKTGGDTETYLNFIELKNK